MPDPKLDAALPRALFLLRIALSVFLLQWGIEKFLVPANTVAIWDYFYGLSVPLALSYAFGAVEVTLALCLALGLFRTVSYGAAALLHTVSVVVSWRQILDPWGVPTNHLFIAGLPVLGGFVALFMLRHWDNWTLDGRPPT